jgi:hypothetical protein
VYGFDFDVDEKQQWGRRKCGVMLEKRGGGGEI